MFVRHILVRHQYEAEDLLRKLDRDCSQFQDLANRHSLCSSKNEGGALGDVSSQLHRLDDDFRDALLQLSVGKVSQPVRTRFGYHLILRES